jgi:hypothetical protein
LFLIYGRKGSHGKRVAGLWDKNIKSFWNNIIVIDPSSVAFAFVGDLIKKLANSQDGTEYTIHKNNEFSSKNEMLMFRVTVISYDI